MAVFSPRRAGSPEYLVAPSTPNPKNMSHDDGRHPPPGLGVCRSQRLPRPQNLRLPPSPPSDPSSGARPLRSHSFHPLFCRAIPPSRTASRRRRRPSARPSPPRMPQLSPAASTHRRSRRLHPPRSSRRLHHPPRLTDVSICHGRRPPPHTHHGCLHPPRPSRRLHPPRPAVVCHGAEERNAARSFVSFSSEKEVEEPWPLPLLS